jgi:hypothetical protein
VAAAGDRIDLAAGTDPADYWAALDAVFAEV